MLVPFKFANFVAAAQAKDAGDSNLSVKPSSLTTTLRQIWLHRVPATGEQLGRLKRRRSLLRQQTVGRPHVDVPEPWPLDLSFVLGWVIHDADE